MNETNLMHIPSSNIGVMETITDYQRLFINNKIGLKSTQSRMKSKRTQVLNCQFDNIEDIWKTLELKYDCYSMSIYKMLIIHEEFIANLSWHYESSHTGIAIVLSSESIQRSNDYILEIESALSKFIVKNKVVSYTILQNDNSEILNEIFYQDSIDVDFNPVATPFIEDVDTYIEDFLNSKAPVMILQGEPGTGKTTFVKYLLQTMQSKVQEKRANFNAMYSFDENIFYLSDFYKRLIFDEYDVLVLEDINQVLHKNQDAEINPINKFLSVTDGLISKYKKIIITTNIESKYQLNPALLRPGRCFDVLEFRKLRGVEIDNLCDSCAKDLQLQTESINLSEFYAKRDASYNTSLLSNKVGF